MTKELTPNEWRLANLVIPTLKTHRKIPFPIGWINITLSNGVFESGCRVLAGDNKSDSNRLVLYPPAESRFLFVDRTVVYDKALELIRFDGSISWKDPMSDEELDFYILQRPGVNIKFLEISQRPHLKQAHARFVADFDNPYRRVIKETLWKKSGLKPYSEQNNTK